MEETHRISIFNQNVFIEREKAKLKPNNHITNGTDERERKNNPDNTLNYQLSNDI